MQGGAPARGRALHGHAGGRAAACGGRGPGDEEAAGVEVCCLLFYNLVLSAVSGLLSMMNMVARCKGALINIFS